MRHRSLISCFWYALLKRSLQLAAVLAYRVRYSGRENIPAEGGVLVVSNHQSHLDPPLVGIGCPRQMNYLARETLFRFAPFGWLLRSVGSIPLDRDGVGLGGIKESLKRLKRGEVVVIFPEGTRTRDGEIGPFRPGFTALAVRAKAAILPMAIDGAFEAFPRTRKFPGPGRIRVHFGEPILPSEFSGRDERELLAEVERRVRACQTLLREQRAATGR
jgi:1-acyl-sn-glycerol-3-phosphate acyltransferase